MAIALKCKMCGGTLEFVPGDSVGVCEYCGTKQTLPKIDDEKKANLYDRANHFRRANDFDKAMGIYEQILDEDLTDAEAYWSLVLCRYGIEYVEDPTTHKRVPTVNRMQYTSIFADEDYKEALKHADSYQQAIYEAEAKEIDSIQKGILAISEKEEPFDVFICYKETDNSGRRTMDSVLAYDIYKELTEAGYKVFFSRVTLEDKLGTAYEPFIFAALNSAKVMVAVGTKTEYYNAVWVKNEWSRYLSMIRNGAKKTLIPVYRDMDPYDLPEEFSHLQGQDMGKIGFMQDLVRGIEKIIGSGSSASINKQDESVPEILEKANGYLEKGDWSNAKVYYAMALDINPKSVEAHLGNLLAAQKVTSIDELKDVTTTFDSTIEYEKVRLFGTQEIRDELATINENISKRKEEIAKRNKSIALRTTKVAGMIAATAVVIALSVTLITKYLVPFIKYNKAINILETENYVDAKQMFSELGNYRDSEGMVQYCVYAEKYENAEKLVQEGKLEDALRVYQQIMAFRDAKTRVADLQETIRETKNNSKYNEAIELMEEGNYMEAAQKFSTIASYKDAEEKIRSCVVLDTEEIMHGALDSSYSTYYSYLLEQDIVSIFEYNNETEKYENIIKWAEEFPTYVESLAWWQKATYQMAVEKIVINPDVELFNNASAMAGLRMLNTMKDDAMTIFGENMPDASFEYVPAEEKLEEIVGPYYERGIVEGNSLKYDTALGELKIPYNIDYRDSAIIYDEILLKITNEISLYTGTWKTDTIKITLTYANGRRNGYYLEYDSFFKKWEREGDIGFEYNADEHFMSIYIGGILYEAHVSGEKLVLSGGGMFAGTYSK